MSYYVAVFNQLHCNIVSASMSHTVGHKQLHPSYWYNNFAKLCHTVIIFGTWEYPVACLFDSLCKIENWEPACQICYCLLSSRQQRETVAATRDPRLHHCRPI